MNRLPFSRGLIRTSNSDLSANNQRPCFLKREIRCWSALAAACFLISCIGVVHAEAGTTRSADDTLDHKQGQISSKRLKDANKDIEQWSQMTKEDLKIPAEEEKLKVAPKHSSADNSETRLTGITDGKKSALNQSPSGSPRAMLVKSKNPVVGTDLTDENDDKEETNEEDEKDETSEDMETTSNDASKDSLSEESAPKDRATEHSADAEPMSTDADVGPVHGMEDPELLVKRNDAESAESNFKQAITTDEGDSVRGIKAELEAAKSAAESKLASPSATDHEIRERKKHVESMFEDQKRAQLAEESLIKDAVTDGNRAVQLESSAKTIAGSSQSAAETEIKDLMDQARNLQLGSKGEKPDYVRAFDLCTAVVEKGGLDGLNCLGELYKHGLGRERDLDQAAKYFKEAAAKGHPAAQRNLAFLYSSGHGVPQNTAMAILNLHFAAVSGDHLAQLAMGYRHMYGVGVPKNCQTSMEFYMPAAEYVVKEMHSNRAQPMIEKQSIAGDGTKAKGTDLDEDVVNYYAYSAERGDAAAQVALGQLHFMGARGLPQDYSEAFRWYIRAAEQGDANAMGHLGNMYAQGIHVAADNQTALSYFRRGVEKGNSLALNGLGFMSMYGMGVVQSYDEAFKSFSKAAEQGNQEARFNLGALHVGGYGVAKDYAKAIYYFTLAANRGHMLALYNLAMMHHNGFGTPRSCPNAVLFIKSVSERGEWAGQLQRAYKLYQAGDVDGALLLYLELAELGIDVAQANAAHILDEERTPFTRGQKARALRAYELSAQQGNMAAELKIGDYYYHGWGTKASYRNAVAHYRAASEARLAQAMFNLGWMHEQGRGVAKDRHLAKRFYDMATEAAPEAAWPAGLCLGRLWLLNAVDAALERVDGLALALNIRFGRHGLKIPMSAVWFPLALEYWDVLLGGVLLLNLLAVVALRAHFTMARLGRR